MSHYWQNLVIAITLTTSFASQGNTIVSVPDKEAFEKYILQAKQPCVVLFQSGCPVCYIAQNILEDIIETHQDVSYFTVDVNNLPVLAQKYNITSLPTILIFKSENSQPPQRLIGPKKGELITAIKKCLP